MWYQEEHKNTRHTTIPQIYLCFGDGKVQLPLLKDPPPLLQHLLFDNNANDSKNYKTSY